MCNKKDGNRRYLRESKNVTIFTSKSPIGRGYFIAASTQR